MNVVIVDDHPLARMGIISILSEDKNIQRIAEASSNKDAAEIVGKEKPEIAVIDLKLGREDGLDTVVYGKKMSPQTKYVILTSFISREEFDRAEELGVDGYVLKEAVAEDILYAIESIGRGKKYYDPGVVSYLKKSRIDNDLTRTLTDREKDVLRELGKGLSNEEIAKQLFISSNTVKKHISSILSKLNFEHRTQAAIFSKCLDNQDI